MRQFYDILAANFKMTVRNRQSLFWLFLFPLIMMSLFGIVFGAGQAKPKLGLVDLDRSELSKSIVDGFKKAKVVEIRRIGAVGPAKQRLRAGDVDGVVVLKKGLSGDVNLALARQTGGLQPAKETPPAKIDLYYDPSATFVSEVVRGAVANVTGRIDRLVGGAPTLLALRSHSVRLRNLRYIDFLVPGMIAMTIMNSAMFGLGGTIVNYRERGILRRLKVTPQPLSIFLAAQITNQLIFSILRAVLLIIVARVAFDVHVIGNYLALLVIIILGSLAFVTIAFSVASFAKTREVADTLGNIISMPMMFLGGVFFPVDGAPAWIKPLIQVLPLKYLADAMRAIMIKGDALSAVRGDLAVLTAVTAFFFVVSIRLWRWE